MQMINEKTFDLAEAAEYLKVHPETVRELVVAGELPAAQVGRSYVMMGSDLTDYLRRQVRAQTQARQAKAEGVKLMEEAAQRPTRARRRRNRPIPTVSEPPSPVG